MTHLYIARKLIDASSWTIKNKSQYYLGAIAPDAVEFRQTYDKKISHICNDDAKWGFVVNDEKWVNNLLNFIEENKNINEMDFLIGYSIHILADIYYGNEIWTPLRLGSNAESYDDVKKISHTESNLVDLQLYQLCTFKNEIWTLLNESKCIDFMDLVNKDDMERIKDNILHKQYRNKEEVNSDGNKIITYKRLLEYIENVIEYIIKILNERIN